jgi:hypothetical protein
MPHLKRLVEGQVGPMTFAEIAEALASVDVSGRDPEWLADWAELIESSTWPHPCLRLGAKHG